MSNSNSPFGLRWSKRLNGGAPNMQLTRMQIAYNNSHVMAKGDLVKQLTSGYIDAYVAADAATCGVFWGCEYPNANAPGGVTYSNIWNAVSGLPSTAQVYAYVITDQDALFEIQTDGSSGAAMTIADFGANAEVVVGSANTTTGFSATALSTTVATTDTLPCRIWGYPDGIGNGYDNTSAYNRVLVKLNTLNFTSRTGVTS